MKKISVKIKNHPCFKNEFAGFDSIGVMNLIIGKNNSGKSRLIDLIDITCKNEWDSSYEYRIKQIIDTSKLRSIFREGNGGGSMYGDHWRDNGIYLDDQEIVWQLKNKKSRIEEIPQLTINRQGLREHLENSLNTVKPPFLGYVHFHLLADRDIQPEAKSSTIELSSDGKGATNIIRHFLLSSDLKYSRDLVTFDILNALNEIFVGSNYFNEIYVQEHDEDSKCEIFLGEEKKGLVALSSSGSGLKTILLILISLHLIPKTHDNDNRSDYIYSFEEPENNLHPGILRRLIKYIYDYCEQYDSIVFVTSHSNVVLDIVASFTHSQIIQVTHDGESARTRLIQARFDQLEALNDLGAKPSDLMQSNCIIWVEGPSDRIYVNKWIELYSDRQLKEGHHYQCAYFGGSLLARYFADIDSTDSDLNSANIISVNPRALLIADSDRKKPGEHIKGRVKIIREQIRSIGGHVWITDAREIENYIPKQSLESLFKKSGIRPIEKYERVLPHHKEKSYFRNVLSMSCSDKVSLAEEVVSDMTKNYIVNIFDLNKQMLKIVSKINEYNHIYD